MSTDLVARLRAQVGMLVHVDIDLINEAADALETANEKLDFIRQTPWYQAVERTEEFYSAANKSLSHQVAKLRGALELWLIAYDDCGPDNGPNLNERDCAEMARTVLEETK